jgi:hypothetical protein
MSRNFFALLVVLVAASACAVRLGGSKPEEYQALALPVDASQSSADAASIIEQTGAKLVLMSAKRDSAWFADVATRSGLELSGPGDVGSTSLAFLTGLKILGDTTIALNVGSNGRLYLHDALYEIDKERNIDLMLISLDASLDLREVVRALLGYIATDVGATAAIVMAVDAPSEQAGDSIAVLMRAAFENAWECADATATNGSPPPMKLRLFFGPSVRMRCLSARTVQGAGTPITARLLVGR